MQDEINQMSNQTENPNLRTEVALITGSRRGIGLGIAVEVAKAGYRVVINGTRSLEESRESIQAVQSIGADCHYIQADISNREAHHKIISEIRSKFGRLNVLVNNAGVAPSPREDILLAAEESFDRLLRINLKGPYFLTRDIANWMIEQQQAAPEQKFKIINISSINAFTASPSRGEYCISKAAISMMTALYAVRLAEYGIGVFEIRPGITKTDMTEVVKDKYDQLIADGLLPFARWGLPEDIGKAVGALCRDYFPYSTGEVIHVDGGFHLKTL
jgi:NAD(P)-dependent dehydrogenase (short-subunit alcohol dehydrogenase family)